MASRSHRWFDDAKLLPDERLVRSGAVLLHIPRLPHWWDGTLFLTTDRLFFLPTVDHERLGDHAFWLAELSLHEPGRHQIRIAVGDKQSTFDFSGAAVAILRDRAAPWIRAIAEAQPHARPQSAFEAPVHRRAAG